MTYFGFKYNCPFCNSHLRTFLPYGFTFPVLKQKAIVGGGYRLNAICPICQSTDRERLVYVYLLHETSLLLKPSRVLHIAPEPRLENVFVKHENINYVTADISMKHVMVKMDITAIDFPTDSFDAVICNHVLEHIIDDRKAMSELYRVLRPAGVAILQVPWSLSLRDTYEDFSITTAKAREEAFGQADHVRIYARDYRSRLEQAGFNVDVFQWVTEGAEFGNPNNRFGLNESEVVYVASKSN